MTYSLAFSPCPNDTFITGAIAEKRIDSALQYSIHIADVEELNNASAQAQFDITKLSFHALMHCTDQYNILPVGAALGYGNGPLIVSRKKIYPDEIPYIKLAGPGENTTANLLAKIFYGKGTSVSHYLFSDIEEVVLSGECDAGIIIHETRFTFQKKGLLKVCDLGEMWEKETSLPLPLGCFVIRQSMAGDIQKKVISDFRRSLDFARKHPETVTGFIQKHAQIKDPEITRQHIGLYVNEFSEELGDKGRQAISVLFAKAKESGIGNGIMPVIC